MIDRESDADLLSRVGVAYQTVVANPESAGPEVARLLTEARESGNLRALVSALRAAAWLERSQLRHDRAAVLLDEAVRIGRRHHLDRELRQALTTRGAVRHEQGRLEAARKDLDQAAMLPGGAADPELDSQRAALLQNSGRLREAAGVYRRILSRSDTPADVRTKAANNLGLIEVWCGHADSALEWLGIAAAAADNVGPGAAAFVSASRAWATVRAGDLSGGLDLYDEAETRWRAAGIPLAELYAEHADALSDLRLIPEALREAERAVVALDEHGFALIAAEAQLRLARLTLLQGQPGAAADAADLVAARLRGHGRAAWASQARLVTVDAHLAMGSIGAHDLAIARRAAITLERAGLIAEAVDGHLTAGRVAVAFGRRRAAEDAWRRAEVLAQGAPLLVRLKGRLAAALAAELAGRADLVLRRARAGLADLARHRAALPSVELRARASAHGAELGRLGLAAGSGRRSTSDVLMWMERTRSAAVGFVDPPEITGIEEELGLLRATQTAIADAKRDGAAVLGDLLARQAVIEDRVRKATWSQRTATHADLPLSIPEIRGALGGQTLVEYDVLGTTIIAAALTARRSWLVELGPMEPVRRLVDDLSFALRRLARTRNSPASVIAARGSAEAALAALTARLIAPLALGAPDGVVVVPVGGLHQVPWTALIDAPVSVAPSATVWVRTATRPPPSLERVSLIAGPELDGAVAEVNAIARVHDGADVVVPPRSDTAAVTTSLAAASLVHLACHGSVRSDNPMFSSLLVSDGPLTVHELDRRGIAPHRMVLAACEASSDVIYPGNEALGFVSSLLARGTSGLIASSIVIPDWEVVPLMTALHRSLRAGSTMAAALHEARGSLDRDDPTSFVSRCAFNAFGAA